MEAKILGQTFLVGSSGVLVKAFSGRQTYSSRLVPPVLQGIEPCRFAEISQNARFIGVRTLSRNWSDKLWVFRAA